MVLDLELGFQDWVMLDDKCFFGGHAEEVDGKVDGQNAGYLLMWTRAVVRIICADVGIIYQTEYQVTRRAGCVAC